MTITFDPPGRRAVLRLPDKPLPDKDELADWAGEFLLPPLATLGGYAIALGLFAMLEYSI